MAADQVIDRSTKVSGNVTGSVFVSGDGNKVSLTVYQTISATAPLAEGENPYLGLLAFTENDAQRFFGRETLVADLLSRYRDLAGDGTTASLRFLAVLGPSGSGKSSLARAGLLAEIAHRPVVPEGQRVAVLTPGADPLGSLAAVLARIATNDPAPLNKTKEFRQALAEANNGVQDGLNQIAEAMGGPPLLVLVDQFEELYSAQAVSDADRTAFIDTLLHAARLAGGRVSVVITFRTDFLGSTQAHSELNRAITDDRGHVMIPAMSPDELRQAIAEPAAQAGHPLDENAVQRLVSETLGLDGALPLLQFALVQIWEGMTDKTNPAPASVTLDRIGGVGGSLGEAAESIYGGLEPQQQPIAQRLFMGLVRFNDNQRPTRRRALLKQLVADEPGKSAEVERAETRAVVMAFADRNRRVLTLSADLAGEETVEVTHEAIFDHWDRLKSWFAEGMEDIRLHERVADAAELWDHSKRPEGSLWRPPDLDLLRQLAAKPTAGLTECETEFYQTSQAAHDKEVAERKRSQLITQVAAWGFGILALVAGIATVAATVQSNAAAVQRSNALAGASRDAALTGDDARALLLALAAFPADGRERPAFAQATAALESALLNQHELMDFRGAEATIRDLRFLDGGRRIATVATDEFRSTSGDLAFWDARTGNRLASPPGEQEIIGVSAAGARLLVRADRDYILIEAASGRVVHAFHNLDYGQLFLSPDGQRVVSTAGGFRLLDAATGQPVDPQQKPVNGRGDPAFSAGGRLLAITTDRGVEVWDSLTGEPIKSFPSKSLGGAEFSPGGRWLAAVVPHSMQVWPMLADKASPRTFAIAPEYVRNLRFSASGDRMLAETRGRPDDDLETSAWVWQLDTGRLVAHIVDLENPEISSDGTTLIGVKDSSVMVYRLDQPDHAFCQAPGLVQWDLLPKLSPDGRTLMVIGDTDLRFFDVTSVTGNGEIPVCASRTAVRLQSHGSPIASAAFSANGRMALTGSKDRTAKLWSIDSAGLAATAAGPAKAPTCAGQGSCPRADSIARVEGDTTVVVKTSATGAVKSRIAWGKQIRDTALAPDGGRLALIDEDGSGALLDTSTKRPIHSWSAKSGHLHSVAFSPDGRRGLTTFDDGAAEIWDAKTGAVLSVLRPEPFGTSDPGNNTTVFTSDGRKIVGRRDDVAEVWDVATGGRLAAYPEHAPSERELDSLFQRADGQALVDEACRRLARDFTDDELKTYSVKPVTAYCPHGGMPWSRRQ